MPFKIADFRDLVRIVEEHPEWRSELRRLLLTEELLSLPQVVRELAEAQRRTEEELHTLAGRVDQLAQRVDDLAQRVDDLTQRVNDLAQRVNDLTQRVNDLTQRVNDLTQRVDGLALRVDQLTEEVRALVTWQKGEAGRREGERYERTTVKRGPVLFGGGYGGATDDPRVRVRLSRWLRPILEDGKVLEADDDPTLADIIWWKGGKVAVVEVSLKVNGRDVERASNRAEVLRSVGVDAFGVVIGEDWDSLEARALARDRKVEWMVAGNPSEGFIAFRRIRP
ncbi:MAG TPA: hypothetical protein ENF74_01585 [Firmicutes bacterium]|nr:hypothetical protein [Bacillota bacterium]